MGNTNCSLSFSTKDISGGPCEMDPNKLFSKEVRNQLGFLIKEYEDILVSQGYLTR